MRPKKRYLSGNAGTEGPTSLLFFDCESWLEEGWEDAPDRANRLRLWTACYVRREGLEFRPPIYARGQTAAAFWDFLDAHCDWSRPLWAFAHNIGFDLTMLDFWTELEKYRYTAGPCDRGLSKKTGEPLKPWRGRMFVESRPTFLVVRGRKGTVKFVDTGNYWPSKLAAIGQKFGIPKGVMPKWNAPESDWWEYCQNDTDVCRVAVCGLLKWWIKEDCGTFKMTAPSLAMQNYMHTSECRDSTGDKVNIILEDDSPARAVERASYMGGRIEPFFLGTFKCPIYQLDCNSLYPHVMARELFPRKRVRQVRNCSVQRLRNFCSAFGAIADVLINTGPVARSYPLKRDGVQAHCCGRFWTTLAGPELLRALLAGDVEKVGEVHLYSLAALFRGWSDRWEARKQEARAAGDDGEAEFCKLIGTSLGGKFGQRGDWWVDADGPRQKARWGLTFRINLVNNSTSIYRYVAGHCQMKTPGLEPANAFPAISSYITSYAREHMRRAFDLLGPRSLLYTATDSIICTKAGYEELVKHDRVHPTRPGDFRLEGIHQEAEICGPNWYRVGDKWTCAGLWGKAREQTPGKWVCQVWDQLGTLMSSNPQGEVHVRTVPLKAMRPVQKNAPAEDGWRQPLRLSLDPEFTDHLPRRSVPLGQREPG